MLDASNEELPYDPEFLTDGGIFDNLGFAWFAIAAKDESDFDYLILSDGSAQLDWDIKGRFARVISRTIRSTDILMQRVADFTIGSFRDSIKANTFHLSLSKVVLPSEVPQPIIVDFQKKLSRVRTDLNGFTSLEMSLLTQHGFEVAWSSLSSLVTVGNALDFEGGSIKSEHPISSTARRLNKARSRPLGLFDSRDWMSFALCAYLLTAVIAGAFPYFYVAKQAAQGELFRSSKMMVPYFTDRKRDARGNFTSERAELSSGWATVYVPGDHRIGDLELPGSEPAGFGSRPTGFFSIERMVSDPELRAAPIIRGAPRTLFYIHGFNTSFDIAVMRMAQIASDVQYDGSWVAYSWPSGGSNWSYFDDLEAIQSSMKHFSDAIQLVRAASDGKIDVVVEGLGAQLLLNLRPDAIPSRKQFGQLVFMMPDIETDLFLERIQRLAQIADHITVIASSVGPNFRASGSTSSDLLGRDGQSPLVANGVDTILLAVGDQGSNKAISVILSSILDGQPPSEIAGLRMMPSKVGSLWRWNGFFGSTDPVN